MTGLQGAVVGVDLGKSGCRVRARMGTETVAAAGPGAPGLAEPGGADAAVAVLTTLVDPMVDGLGVAALAVGAAGAGADARSARELGAALAAHHAGSCVAVAGDSVTAHLGALSGRPGVVLSAGTGAVAYGVCDQGRSVHVDGWGQWLGDDGGGAWIGRAALRAVLRARDGRGPATDLTGAAERRYGDLPALSRTLPLQPATAGATAAFVPDVLACARAGDAVARDLLAEAARLLAETTLAALPAPALAAPALPAPALPAPAERDVSTAAAAPDPSKRHSQRGHEPVEVAIVGGLIAVPELVAGWREALPVGLRVVPAEGSGVDGALLLAERRDLPHEAAVWRTGREEVP